MPIYSIKSLLLIGLTFIILSLSMHQRLSAAPTYDPFDLKATLTIEDAQLLKPRQKIESQRPNNERRLVIALPVNLDLKAISGIEFGELNILGLVIKEDRNLSLGRPMVDDVHAYSNLRAEDRAQLFELYWSKECQGTTLRLGKLDANDHFAVSEHESMLINGAAGFSPSILGMPSYPDSAWSIQAAQRMGILDLSVGVFDGGSTTLTPTPTGSKFGWSEQVKEGGLFYVVQVTTHLGGKEDMVEQTTETNELQELIAFQQDRDFETRSPLQITVGAWTHRGEVAIETGEPRGASGMYLTSDLKLLKTKRGGELGLGGQLALTTYLIPVHASLALTITELSEPVAWATRGLSLALGLSHIQLADHSGEQTLKSNESLFEATITAPLSPSLQLSLSWIYLNGDLLHSNNAQLIVSRLTLGTF